MLPAEGGGSYDWRVSVKSFLLSHRDAFNLGEVVRLGLQSLGRRAQRTTVSCQAQVRAGKGKQFATLNARP